MDYSNTMNSMRSRGMNDECRQTRQRLPDELLGILDDNASFGMYHHIRHCRSCLEAYIALQAAADMALPDARNT